MFHWITNAKISKLNYDDAICSESFKHELKQKNKTTKYIELPIGKIEYNKGKKKKTKSDPLQRVANGMKNVSVTDMNERSFRNNFYD